MLKLIRLEWKKNGIGKYIAGAGITALLLGSFLFALAFLGIANDPDGTLDAAPGMDVISAPIELFTSMAFLVYTSVMLASFIVRAYRNRTMNLMFSYPIKRQKILASQMLAVWLFNVLALILTKLAVYLCVTAGARWMPSSFAIDFDMGNVFIALFVGLAFRSSKAVVVTSLLLIFLTQANIGDFTMAGNAVLPIVLTLVSLGFAILSLYNAEKKDLI